MRALRNPRDPFMARYRRRQSLQHLSRGREKRRRWNDGEKWGRGEKLPRLETVEKEYSNDPLLQTETQLHHKDGTQGQGSSSHFQKTGFFLIFFLLIYNKLVIKKKFLYIFFFLLKYKINLWFLNLLLKPIKAPSAVATPVTSNFVFYKGSYFQIGDIVSMEDTDGGIYYAQIRGLLTDQYCEKSAAVTWLLPTTAR